MNVTFVEMNIVIGVLRVSFNGVSRVSGNIVIANRLAHAVPVEILFVIHVPSQMTICVHLAVLN